MLSALFKVRGNSMVPTLEHGDYVIGRRPSRRRPIQVGDVVVLHHPRYGAMVKRVHQTNTDGSFLVRGDGAATTASVDLGNIEQGWISRRVVWRISKQGLHRL